MAAMIIITNDIAVSTLVGGALGLPAEKVVRETGTVKHPQTAGVLEDGVAGTVAQDRKVVIGGPLIGRAGGHKLLMVVAVQMNAQDELAHVVFAMDAPGALLGPSQCRQQQGGENGNNCDDHQEFD